MNAQTEILLLYLLWFNDERVVFKENELKTIEKIIEESMGPYIDGNEENKEGTWRIYKLKEKFIQEMIKNESPRPFTTKSVEMGYYHHRIIFKIILDFKGNFRELRGKIDDLSASLNKRIDDTNRRIDDLNNSLNKRIDDMNKRIDEIKEDLKSLHQEVSSIKSDVIALMREKLKAT